MNSQINMQLVPDKNSWGLVLDPPGRGWNSYYVHWLCEGGGVRTPKTSTVQYEYPGSFTVAGKEYTTIKELCYKWKTIDNPVCYDIYGGKWICITEKYPCFDESDWEYENRFYRWFYINEGDKLFCVYLDDGLNKITITEDVAKLDQSHIVEMKRYGWLPEYV